MFFLFALVTKTLWKNRIVLAFHTAHVLFFKRNLRGSLLDVLRIVHFVMYYY